MVFLCDKTVQTKRKEKSFQSMLEILVPPGRIRLVGPGLPRRCWVKEWSSIMHPRLGGVCCSWWSCCEERRISDPKAGCWASQRRNSLACTATKNENWVNVIAAINTRGMDSRKGSSSVVGLLICKLGQCFLIVKTDLMKDVISPHRLCFSSSLRP